MKFSMDYGRKSKHYEFYAIYGVGTILYKQKKKKQNKNPQNKYTEAPELKYKNTKIKRRIQTARLTNTF